jgi:hypothetical protein
MVTVSAERMMKAIFFVILVLALILTASAQMDYCGVQTLYFQHQSVPDIPGYETLVNFPSGNAEVDESITIKNTDGPVLIDTYILPAGTMEHVTMLLRGLRVFTTFHYVNTATGTTVVNFTAFQRFSNGTEVNFYSQLSDDINSLVPSDYTTYRVSTQNLTITPSDRLGIKIYGQTTHSSPVVLHFVYQGQSNTSHFDSGFFVCKEPATVEDIDKAVNSSGGSEPVAIIFGIIGGLIGGILIYYRNKGDEK